VRAQDDIQGTASTAVAGLYGALRALGREPPHLAAQRVVCVGAGSAGMGVVGMIANGAPPRRCCFAPRSTPSRTRGGARPPLVPQQLRSNKCDGLQRAAHLSILQSWLPGS
jgi:hypothetical protein